MDSGDYREGNKNLLANCLRLRGKSMAIPSLRPQCSGTKGWIQEKSCSQQQTEMLGQQQKVSFRILTAAGELEPERTLEAIVLLGDGSSGT